MTDQDQAPETPEPWPPGLATVLDKLTAKVDGHRQWLENLGASVASALEIAQTPGPYAELASAVKALQDEHDVLKRMQGHLEVLIDHQTTPQLTVRHWLASDGTWAYETTVSLKPESEAAMPNTLRWVDEMARAESRRREAADRG